MGGGHGCDVLQTEQLPLTEAHPSPKENHNDTLLDNANLAGFPSSIINLLKAIMGAGMLSLPFAFSTVGLVPGVIMLVVAAALSAMGLQLLTLASHRIIRMQLAPARQASFAALAGPTYPRASFLFDLAVVIKCLGVAVSYLTVIGDLLPQLARGMAGGKSLLGWLAPLEWRFFWVSLTVLLIAPVTFMRKMDSLKYTSFFGLLGIAYLFTISIVLFFTYNATPAHSLANLHLFVPLSLKSLRSFSIFVFAFTCHQNVFPLYNESRDNSPSHMLRLFVLCISVSLAVYTIFATCFYGVFGNEITGNVIRNFPQDGLPYILARLLYVLLMVFSYPLQTFPARSSLERLLGGLAKGSAKREKLVHAILTTLILLTTWILSAFWLPLDTILALIGCTAGPIICYFLPAIFWCKLEELEKGRVAKNLEEDMESARRGEEVIGDNLKKKKSPLLKIKPGQLVAISLFLFGLFSTIIPLTALILSLAL